MMNRKNKILIGAIALMVVFCVVIGTLIFLEKNKRALLQEANTKLVKENEKNKLKTDLQSGKVLKVEGDQIEFLQISDGGEALPEDQQKTKKIKLTDETKISVPCVFLQNFEMEKIPPEELAVENSQDSEGDTENKKTLTASDPEETCSAPKEILQPDQFISIREKQGTALLITFH